MYEHMTALNTEIDAFGAGMVVTGAGRRRDGRRRLG
jgi:hypothetical protein